MDLMERLNQPAARSALSGAAALSVFVAIVFLGAPAWIFVLAMYGTAMILSAMSSYVDRHTGRRFL